MPDPTPAEAPALGEYVVPARRLLAAIHRPDPDRPGRTACGEEMTADGLWVTWPYDPGRDRLCAGCSGRPPAPEDTLL